MVRKLFWKFQIFVVSGRLQVERERGSSVPEEGPLSREGPADCQA